MKSRIRLTCLLLSVLMVLFAVACADNTDDNKNDETSETTNETVETTPAVVTDIAGNITTADNVDADGYMKDTLSDYLNYNGKTVTFLVWDGQDYQEFDAEVTGEPVSDSLYNRNRNVEDRLGVKLNFVETKGGADDYQSFNKMVLADINAGAQHEYDMIAAYSRTTAMCAYNGYTANLLDTEYFNADMPWWPNTLMNQSAFNGKLYFCSGDIALSVFKNLDVIYVNKEIAEQTGTTVDMMYQSVIDGKWTLDKMIELSTNVYRDENSNGLKDKDDTFGYMASNTQSQILVWGSGITAIDIKDNKMVISDSFKSEKMQGILEKLCNWMFNTNDAMMDSGSNNAFKQGRLLFFSNIAKYTMDASYNDGIEFGILPPPKFDEAQKDYYSVIGNAFTLYAIINNSTDKDMCSAVLECMGSEGYRKISPTIFEAAMKVKYAYDDTTSQMYDITRSGVIFDNGRIFSSVFSDAFTKSYNDCVKNNNTAWMSKIKSIEPSIQKTIDSINDIFDSLN